MIHFDNIKNISISYETLNKAKKFAEDVSKTTFYKDSNQNSQSKIIDDHFVSKVGEEAARIACEEFGVVVTGPDYKIYSGYNKSWDCDLYIDGVGLAIKTQRHETALRFGLSWTFQSAPTRHDPILRQPEAWVAFVEFNENTRTCAVYPFQQIKNLVFGEPKLDYLKGKKKVVYLKDNINVFLQPVPVQQALGL
jgi:hypothetical protein